MLSHLTTLGADLFQRHVCAVSLQKTGQISAREKLLLSVMKKRIFLADRITERQSLSASTGIMLDLFHMSCEVGGILSAPITHTHSARLSVLRRSQSKLREV